MFLNLWIADLCVGLRYVMSFATGLFTNRSWDIPEEIKYNKETNNKMKITIPTKPLTYDLVELVVHFEDNKTESMIVSLDSFAHEAVKWWASANGYKLDCLTPDETTLVV